MSEISGTKEWSKYSENCIIGCANGCRYCYARYNAVDRFHQVSPEVWEKEMVNPNKMKKGFGKRSGTIMFPTAHDITPRNIDTCVEFLHKMLKPGNKVLIVTKPDILCVVRMCDEFGQYKDNILFRFTISSRNNDLLSYWEPGAPKFESRYAALCHAYERGFDTSVSMEPCLDWDDCLGLFNVLAPKVTNSIWIGTLNKPEKRVHVETEEDKERLQELMSKQTQANFERVYSELKNHSLVRWKDSLKQALNLERPTEAGLDI